MKPRRRGDTYVAGMGGDLRRVERWVQRCGFAAWGFVALSVLPVPAEPQATALEGLRVDASRLAVELGEARDAARRAEYKVDAERERARELAEHALDRDIARGTTDAEAFERQMEEIADARTRLGAAERDFEDKSARLIVLEATLAKAEQKRLAEELAARARDLEQTNARAAKTEASLGHANAERKRLTQRLDSLEREIARAKRRPGTKGESLRNRSRTRVTQVHRANKGATEARQIATRRAKGKRPPPPTRIRDSRQAARNRAPQ